MSARLVAHPPTPASTAADSSNLRLLRTGLLKWYDHNRRDLPWRVPIASRGLPDPYYVLVSEAMLQQTQVAAVIPYFLRFLERFPTVSALAAADEQDVLRLWQGLGYYSRARNLHKAAQRILTDHEAQIPRTVETLLNLPGVGRYTAGAIASLAYDCRAPILDGNVIRVLCRIDHITTDPREKSTQQKLWHRAEEILPKKRCGDFNSALMELGATVCTPRNPKCLLCPIQKQCKAFTKRDQEKIPVPRKTKLTPHFERNVIAIRNGDRYLIEQRPTKGRWAGMWQFITLDADADVRKPLELRITPPRRIAEISHALTHRRYTFNIYTADLKHPLADPAPRLWLTIKELDAYPLPQPHLRVIDLLRKNHAKSAPAQIARRPRIDQPPR